MLPYKRFATETLISRAEDYLENPLVTYRETVRHDRCLIGYPVASVVSAATPATPATSTADTSPPHQPVIDHSLIWRAVGWLGGLTCVLDQACVMLLQRNPDSLCLRQNQTPDPKDRFASHKSRSDQRLMALETARRLLRMIPEWEACFGYKFFPRFATRVGFE